MKKDNNLLDYVPLIAQQIQWSENEDTIVTVDVVNEKECLTGSLRFALDDQKSAILHWKNLEALSGNRSTENIQFMTLQCWYKSNSVKKPNRCMTVCLLIFVPYKGMVLLCCRHRKINNMINI